MQLAVTLEGADALRARLETLGRQAPVAIARAVNRTLSTVQTATVRALATNTNLAQKDVRKALSITRARPGNPEGVLRVTGRRIPLLAFGARQTRGGVTYRLGQGRGLAPSAFLATMRSGHRGVFKRKGSPRLPITELFGPSLPHVVVNQRIFEALQVKGQETLKARLEHEIQFLIDRGAVSSESDA